MSWFTHLVFSMTQRVRLLAALCGVPAGVSWNMRNRIELDRFFRTETGARLIHSMRNSAIMATQRAVYRPGQDATEYAKGWQEAFNFVCKLSAIDPLQVAEHERGKVSLTDNKDTPENQPDQEGPEAEEYESYLGSSIGMR